MRWSISTSTVDKEIEGTDNKYKRITTTTKKQYITIGDIVGYGKSFSGAVKALCKTLPTMIKSMNKSGNTSGAAIAQSALSIATPLSAVIKGTEIYKKITRVSNIVNPIFKTVARLTGVWNSPGNALDIAQITVGVVQQILVGIIVAAIIGLKNKIWNYELPIDETSEETSVIITKNVTNSAAKINGTVISNLTTANLNLAPGYTTEEQQQLEDIYNAINERVGMIYPATENFTEVIADAMKQEVSEEAEENKLYNDSWITDYTLEGANRFRELRGSINNKGIQYSDVEEEGNIVWKDSNITTGNFCCFAKLETGSGNTVYLAGSEPFMTEDSIASTSDTSWSMDANNHYNKDYYGDDLVKYTKYYKDNNEISADARVRRNSASSLAAHYNFNKFDIPNDGNYIKKRDNDFTNKDGWSSRIKGDFDVTVEGGKLHVSRITGTNEQATWNIQIPSNSSEGKILKIRIKSNSSMNIKIQTYDNDETENKWHTYYEKDLTPGETIDVTDVLIKKTNNNLYIWSSGSEQDYYIEQFYVGDNYCNIKDESGNNNDGSVYGGAYILDAEKRYAIKFQKNSKGYFKADLPFAADTTTKYTIAARITNWNKTDDVHVINNWSSYSISSLRLGLYSNKISADVLSSYGKVLRFNFDYDFANDNSDVFNIILSCNAGETALYINNEKINGTYAEASVGSSTYGRNWFQVGRICGENDYKYDNMCIDELKIYNRNLSEEEIKSGIYYSTDNGVTWQQSYIINEYIGNMLELEEKDDGNGGTIPARVVASSYDYHGLWYSEDGISWTKSIMINEDETEENITTDRYVCFGTSECKRYRINTSEIVVEPECYFKTFTGVNPEQHPDDNFVIPIIEGDGTNPLSIVRRIMDYLHEELPRNYWLSKGEEFLDELISKIQSNNLTVDDFYGITEETLDEFVEGGN